MNISRLLDPTKSWHLRTKLLGTVVAIFIPLFGVAFLLLPQLSIILLLAAALFLTSSAGWLMAGATSSQLRSITEQVSRRAKSHDFAMLKARASDDEIGRLIEAINELVAIGREENQRLSRRADELDLLQELAATISRTLDLQQVLDLSLHHALDVSDWDAGAIYLLDKRTDSFDIVTYYGLSEDYVRDAFSYKMGEGMIGQAAYKRETFVTTVKPSQDASHELAAQIIIPLIATDHVLGVLNLGSKVPREPQARLRELLTTIGHQIAVALEKAQLHHDLTRHAQELEGMVHARTEELAIAIDELSDALERAQQADKVKSQLLSTVSHELRTPLATIKGNTSMLVDHHQNVTSEMLLQFLTDIEEESDKLAELIDNLLEMSRIEAGVLHVQPQKFDLLDVVRGTVEAAQLRMDTHPLKLRLPGDRSLVMADARRVQQILDNLLNNAAKYSNADSPIYVQVRLRADHAVVSVRDEGYGIPADHLQNIFDRFYRVGQDKVRTRGIGLGLAICKGLVEAQGGRIWVASEVNKGSEFSFSLPHDEVGIMQISHETHET